ncbi:hypothetical protein LSB85_004500 [Salmonella enterica]|nr:hypothetical protein [Salmonella enterica]
MPKIQARNVPDDVYASLENSALKNDRSVEAEIRVALRERYLPAETETAAESLSLRERWQRETGARLQQLFDRLITDGYFPEFRNSSRAGLPELARLARDLHEPTPGRLMECLEGRLDVTFERADRIATRFCASADWLLTGSCTPFPVQRIGSSYRDFFMPDGYADDNDVFELVRIDGGRHDGTLFCLRYSTKSPRTIALGVVTEQFKLAGGMGSGGHANLKAFLTFLKTAGAQLAINAFSWTPDEAEFDFWSVFGQHHPVWFQNAGRRTSARWLQQLLNGEDPGGWFEGYTSDLDEIRALAPGARTSGNDTGDTDTESQTDEN